MNAIYLTSDSSDELVLRVGAPSAPAEAALELSMFLSEEGLRVPKPRRLGAVVAGDLAVTCWERIESTGDPTDWEAVGEMVRTVHGLDRSQLPPAYPLGSPASFAWWDFDALFAEVGNDIDAAARGGLTAAIERHTGWEQFDDALVCHGDVHPGNVMMTADGPALIDWDLLCWAPAGWDHGPLMTWHERWGGAVGEYDAFASGYGASLRDDPTTEALAELRLVAATLMRLKAARRDPSARPEADRRLAYWRGDPDAPPWTAQ
jgi:Ser/Thr protein kinase RdoA (MazF antagonist)